MSFGRTRCGGPSRLPLEILTLAAVGTTACSNAESPRGSMTVVDSAGVQIVESWTPQWGEGESWALHPNPFLEIQPPGGDSSHQLFGVVGAFQVESTREIVIANKGTSEVLVFDSVGTFLRAIGRRGHGPGELEGLNGLRPCGDGRFLVDEGRRASIFNVDGDLIQMTPSEWRDIFNFEDVSSDCSKLLFMVPDPSDELTEGLVRPWTGTLSWGDLNTHNRTPLATIPVFDMVGRTVDGWLQWVAHPWWKRSRWVVSGNRVLLGTGESTEVQVWDVDRGLVKLVRWPGGSPPVTSADRDQNARVRARSLAERPERAAFIPPLGEIYVPKRSPHFGICGWTIRGIYGSRSTRFGTVGGDSVGKTGSAHSRSSGPCSTRRVECSASWTFRRRSRCSPSIPTTSWHSGGMISTWSTSASIGLWGRSLFMDRGVGL